MNSNIIDGVMEDNSEYDTNHGAAHPQKKAAAQSWSLDPFRRVVRYMVDIHCQKEVFKGDKIAEVHRRLLAEGHLYPNYVLASFANT